VFTALSENAASGTDSALPFASALLEKIAGPAFHDITDTFVDAFVPSGGREVRQRVSPSKIVVEIVYALPDRQVLRRILLPGGSTVEDAIRVSGLRAAISRNRSTRVGIHGKPVPVTAILRDRSALKSTGRCGLIPRT